MALRYWFIGEIALGVRLFSSTTMYNAILLHEVNMDLALRQEPQKQAIQVNLAKHHQPWGVRLLIMQ